MDNARFPFPFKFYSSDRCVKQILKIMIRGVYDHLNGNKIILLSPIYTSEKSSQLVISYLHEKVFQ